MHKRDMHMMAVLAAVADEQSRFNRAINNGVEVVIDSKDSLANGHTVLSVRPDFWIVTQSPAGTTHTWAFCNDGRWADLLRKAGVARHHLFA